MITSLTNQNVKIWAKLHQKKYRDQYQLFLIEDDHLIKESINNNCLHTLLTSSDECKYNFDNIVLVDNNIIKKLSQLSSKTNYIGVCKYPCYNIDIFNRVLLLDEIQDPGNLGTIIRNAKAFNYDGIYLSNNCCDVYNDKCIRATQGSLFDIPIIRCNLVDVVNNLKNIGVNIYGTSLKDSISIDKVEAKDKMAFVVGNEGKGVSDNILELCDEKIIIPSNGFESLNVAVATGIIMYRYH